MKISVLTLFPEMITPIVESSILKRASERGVVSYETINFRDYADNKHRSVDDYPYGGGAGMVLTPQPLFDAVEAATKDCEKNPRVILMCPQGKTFTQADAEALSEEENLVFLCGHYEGYDERVRDYLVTDEYSIGDYVLTGGELGALVMIDAIVRLLPDAITKESHQKDSFSTGLLEHPQYTRPRDFRGMTVPDVLTSGNHAKIEEWRQIQSVKRTYERRPDLLESAPLTDIQRKWLVTQDDNE